MPPHHHSNNHQRLVRGNAFRGVVALIWLLCWQAVSASLPPLGVQDDEALLQQVQQVRCSLAITPDDSDSAGQTHCPLCTHVTPVALPSSTSFACHPAGPVHWPSVRQEPATYPPGMGPQSARGPPVQV